MNKIFNILLTLAISSFTLTLTSCSETEEVSEYENWEVRNKLFIDSIAQECENNADGKWMKICAYTFDETIEATKNNKNHYVYIHKEEDGTGTYKPLFNDTVRVHYKGQIIPTTSYPTGYVFDKSYSNNTLDEKVDVPYKNCVNGYVVGFTTVLMQMVEGDRWKVYIPSYLGYDGNSSSPLPESSAMIFDIKMARIYKCGHTGNSAWF